MTAVNYAEMNQYEMLSKFESMADFNNTFEQAMVAHKDLFTKSEYVALNKLRKFAATFYGVAWCRIQKAVAATHQDEMFGVSRRTFDRMLAKARKLNLITVINQARKNKWQKHSVYVFNQLDELTPEVFEIVYISPTIDVPVPAKIDAPITSNLSELPKQKDLNTYPQAENVSVSNEDVVDFKESKTDYQRMNNLVANLFEDKKTVYRMYGAWLGQTKKMINRPSIDIAIEATKTLVQEVKRRIALDINPLQNPTGYFNGILTKMIDVWVDEELDALRQEFS